MNGRLTGDLDGKYTCYQTNGASTVDYALPSEDLVKTILGSQVQALTTYSYHCPISLKLTSSRPHMVEDNAPRQPLCKAVPTQKNFKKFLWKADSKDKFLSALSNPNVQRLFDSFNSEHHASVDDEISQFNQIINSVAKSCLPASRKTSKTTKEKKPWYDHTCRQLRKQLQQLVKKINPSSQQSLRQDYFVLKKKYKKRVKMMHKRYKKQIVNEINALIYIQNTVKISGGILINLEKAMLPKRKPLFRQKIGYVIIRSYYMIARNRTPLRTFQMKILTWKTKIYRITTF